MVSREGREDVMRTDVQVAPKEPWKTKHCSKYLRSSHGSADIGIEGGFVR